MSSIILQNVSIDFPIYNLNARSLKKKFLSLATGGKISTTENNKVIVKSLNNISFTLKHGDRIGLIGHNGAGKSTLLKLLANIYEPTTGHCQIQGRVNPLFNLMHGIENEFTGFENIVQRGILLGLTKKQITLQIEEIAELSGLGDYLQVPVRTYSLGMMMRLAFAISTCIQPDILVIDEVFGAGDADFLHKAQKRMTNLLKKSSIVVLASHSNDIIKDFCTKVLLLESGNLKFFGDVQAGLDLYCIR